VLGAELLSRDMVSKLSAPIVSVTDDFITRLRDVRDLSGDRAVVDQLSSYVRRWTLEGKFDSEYSSQIGQLSEQSFS